MQIARDRNGNTFHGRIDKMAFHAAVLTQQQITSHWNARAQAGTVSTPDSLYLCRQLADGTYGMAESAMT